MKSLAAVFAIAVVLCGRVAAADLEVAIRIHPAEIIVGDPLYVEVTITNRGREPVKGPTPDLLLGSLRFDMRETRRRLIDDGDG